MNRKKSREITMKLVYEMMINKTKAGETVENYKENTEEKLNNIDIEYIELILKGVEENVEELDSTIEKNLNKWKINRISKLNLAILRMAAYEILYMEDIPAAVTINEAVELAKVYSEHNASGFINGVLDKIHKNK